MVATYFRTSISLLILSILGIFTVSDSAFALEEPGSGVLTLTDTATGSTVTALQLDTEIDITISGMVAQVNLRQTFSNQTSDWREGRYVFPLPDQAAIEDFVLVIKDRRIESELQPRRIAEQTYRRAKKAGKRVAKIEQHRPNLFSTSVANIDPGAKVAIEIHYLQTVSYAGGQFSLRVPTTLTPRYMPGVALQPDEPQKDKGWSTPTSQVEDADRISPPQFHHGYGPNQYMKVQVQLDAGHKLAGVEANSADLRVSARENHYRIRPATETILMNRDFELNWWFENSDEALVSVFEQNVGDERYALIMFAPPTVRSSRDNRGRELVFVIDTSGSMAGASIRQAKRALIRALGTLNTNDYFNIIQFNDGVSSLFGDSVAASSRNIDVGRDFVAGLEADGGTEIAPALALSLSPPVSERLKQIVFITDGAVGNEAALVQKLRRQLGEQRVFTVGIGAAPNSWFMRKLAEAGRGSHIHIDNIGSVYEDMDVLLGRLANPSLTSIDIAWPGSAEAYPAIVPDLYMGEPLMVLVKWREDLNSLEIKGTSDRFTWRHQLHLEGDGQSKGVATLWARRKIEALMDEMYTAEQGQQDSYQRRITDIAMKYGLVSRYTSLVAVDKTPARTAEAVLRSGAVPNMMPAGSHQLAPLPQTATGVWMILLMGVMFISVAMLIRRRT